MTPLVFAGVLVAATPFAPSPAFSDGAGRGGAGSSSPDQPPPGFRETAAPERVAALPEPLPTIDSVEEARAWAGFVNLFSGGAVERAYLERTRLSLPPPPPVLDPADLPDLPEELPEPGSGAEPPRPPTEASPFTEAVL